MLGGCSIWPKHFSSDGALASVSNVLRMSWGAGLNLLCDLGRQGHLGGHGLRSCAPTPVHHQLQGDRPHGLLPLRQHGQPLPMVLLHVLSSPSSLSPVHHSPMILTFSIFHESYALCLRKKFVLLCSLVFLQAFRCPAFPSSIMVYGWLLTILVGGLQLP